MCPDTVLFAHGDLIFSQAYSSLEIVHHKAYSCSLFTKKLVICAC